MVEVLLFHHAQGLTPGIREFADTLRRDGHIVHMPDLFDGRIFSNLEDGLGHVEEIGFDNLKERGLRVADHLPFEIVYAGFSFGVVPAQQLAQTRANARGALFFHSCLPIRGEWSFGPWPESVPVQIHGMDSDAIFIGDGDIDAAREIAEQSKDAHLFLYPGDQHLFADSSLSSYDAGATELLTGHVLEFLDSV